MSDFFKSVIGKDVLPAESPPLHDHVMKIVRDMIVEGRRSNSSEIMITGVLPSVIEALREEGFYVRYGFTYADDTSHMLGVWVVELETGFYKKKPETSGDASNS